MRCRRSGSPKSKTDGPQAALSPVDPGGPHRYLRSGVGDEVKVVLARARVEGQRYRLRTGVFGDLITFSPPEGALTASAAAGDASRIGSEPLNLFWFAHHTVLMAALARLPAVPCLSYGNSADLERQLCEFILRGIGLNETAIASHLVRELSAAPGQSIAAESA